MWFLLFIHLILSTLEIWLAIKHSFSVNCNLLLMILLSQLGSSSHIFPLPRSMILHMAWRFIGNIHLIWKVATVKFWEAFMSFGFFFPHFILFFFWCLRFLYRFYFSCFGKCFKKRKCLKQFHEFGSNFICSG